MDITSSDIIGSPRLFSVHLSAVFHVVGHFSERFLEGSQPVVLANYHGSMKTVMASGSADAW